jgi:hypothetical protein
VSDFHCGYQYFIFKTSVKLGYTVDGAMPMDWLVFALEGRVSASSFLIMTVVNLC